MSELKAISSGEIYNIIEYEGSCITDDLYYPKSEADKVIAERDEKIDELKERIDELQKATDSAWSKVNAMYDELRHQKYKRCLAMSKWCNDRYILDDCLYELGKTRFYERWEKRWLELAEKFKERKNAED